MRDELGIRDAEIARLQHEKFDLIRDARSAKDYRDELDSLQQKVTNFIYKCIICQLFLVIEIGTT